VRFFLWFLHVIPQSWDDNWKIKFPSGRIISQLGFSCIDLFIFNIGNFVVNKFVVKLNFMDPNDCSNFPFLYKIDHNVFKTNSIHCVKIFEYNLIVLNFMLIVLSIELILDYEYCNYGWIHRSRNHNQYDDLYQHAYKMFHERMILSWLLIFDGDWKLVIERQYNKW